MAGSKRLVADLLVVLLAGISFGYLLIWRAELFTGLLVVAWIGVVYRPLRRGERERAVVVCGLWGLVVGAPLLGNPVLFLAAILVAGLGYLVWTRERRSGTAQL